MKKTLSVAVLLLVLLLLAGCGGKETKEEQVDFSHLPFVGVAFERDGGNDIETIYFGADGSFRYYCSCGNPVNDSDLCEGYSYEEDSKTIYFSYIEETEETVNEVKVVKCLDTELHLDFNGETRVFTKAD